MDLKISEQFENRLLHRKEVRGWVTFAGPTPSNADVQLQLATKLSTDKELVVVDHIYNTYGSQEAKIFAKAYEKKQFLDRYEPKTKAPKKKEGAPEDAAPAEAPAAEKPEAAPAEAAPANKPAEAKPAEAPADKPAETPAAEKPAEKPEGGES